MWRIGIAGPGSELFFRSAQERFAGKEVRLDRLFDGADCDAFLLMPEATPCGASIRCNCLILPEGTPIGGMDARCVVSYGMSQKNTITLSSALEGKNVIALQRDVASLDGRIILRQEFLLDSALNPYETLALASLLLITGECGT